MREIATHERKPAVGMVARYKPHAQSVLAGVEGSVHHLGWAEPPMFTRRSLVYVEVEYDHDGSSPIIVRFVPDELEVKTFDGLWADVYS